MTGGQMANFPRDGRGFQQTPKRASKRPKTNIQSANRLLNNWGKEAKSGGEAPACVNTLRLKVFHTFWKQRKS
jgi:hypothetical protein